MATTLAEAPPRAPQRPGRPHRPRARPALVALAVAGAVLGLGFLSAGVGSHPISPGTVWDAVVRFDPTDNDHLLVVHLRLPRAALAIVAGAALGAAGVLMQSVSRNALAEPGLLGVNAGAAVAVVVAIAALGVTTPAGYLVFAVAGAGVAGAGVLLLGGARRGTDPVRLVLAGAAVTVVLGAATQIVLVNAEDHVFDRFRNWTVGSLQGRDLTVLIPVTALVAIGLVLAFLLCRSLDAAALGPDVARSLGTRAEVVWAVAGIAVVLLAGGATAAAGPLVFVGLTAPHVARAWVGTGHRHLLPATIAIAALLLLGADTLGRVVALPGEVGVGIMAALIGGPFFVVLVRLRTLVLP